MPRRKPQTCATEINMKKPLERERLDHTSKLEETLT